MAAECSFMSKDYFCMYFMVLEFMVAVGSCGTSYVNSYDSLGKLWDNFCLGKLWNNLC